LHLTLIVLLLALSSLVPSGRACGDAIVLTRAMNATTIAEYSVSESGVRVDLEIGSQDLRAFRNLMPDWLYEELGFAAEAQAVRLQRFFEEDLVIRSADGAPLAGRVVEIGPQPRTQRDEITGEPLPPEEGEEDTVVFAVLEYAFAGRPEQLSFSAPRFVPGVPAASVGFVVYHMEIPVIDFRYLGAEFVLDLDWDDPWYSRFRSRNMRRQYDAPMNAFLYVEPTEVRVELIVRPVDLQDWIDLGLEGRRTIPVEMQPELKRRVAEFLTAHSPVTIDGEPVTGVLDRVHFLRRTLRSSTVIDPPEELNAFAATLGVIFVYPRVGLPQAATLTWDLFSDKIQRVPGAATDEAGPLRTVLEPDFAVLRWQNFLKNPTSSMLAEVTPPPSLSPRVLRMAGAGLALPAALLLLWQGSRALRGRGAARRLLAIGAIGALAATLMLVAAHRTRVDETRAREILGALLHNVYRSFDFYEESAIYDVLAQSVTGDLLADIYLETRRSLVLASQGGARAKVKKVEIVEVETRPSSSGPGFIARATWTVMGAVGHWGHIHQRRNQYQADLSLEPVDGRWKITALDLIQGERI
jgi:hypothetical protein